MKKNLLKRALVLSLSAVCFMSGCDFIGGLSGGGNGSSDSSSSTVVTGEYVANTTDLDYKPANTNVVLAENGKTDYTIVVNDEDKNGTLAFAASELRYFFQETTGASLSIVTDEGLTFDENEKYIVLGSNDVSKGSGMNITYEEYGKDGSYIKRKGNTLLINSFYDAGAKYGVYSFLWYNLGVKIYAGDEMKIPDLTKEKVYLKDFDYKNIPDYAERTSGLNERKNETTCYRLGYDKGHGENWYLWCHTSFQLLPKETYYEKHPDWYSPTATQLCYTNEEMLLEMTRVMKEEWISKTTFRRDTPGFFQIGLEDNTNFCDCDNCKASAAANGGNSGTLMIFMNKLADIMNAWVEETYPDITPIQWVTFAYAATTEPPVKKLEDGTYVPYNDAVKAHENVGVMYAPLRANFAYNLTDAEYNDQFNRMIRGWDAIGAKTYVYTYTQIYDNYFYYMDNWSMLKEQYKTFVDMDAVYMFDEGGSDGIPFSELRDYVHGKLMWDVDADLEYYISDFLDNYFKCASPYISEYFNRLRSHTREMERIAKANGTDFRWMTYMDRAPEMNSKEYWPMDWILSCLDLFDKAIEEIEKLPEGDEKALLLKRVKEERTSPIYILLDVYANELSKEEIRYYVDEFESACEQSGITVCAQKVTVQNKVGAWRALLED